MGGEKLLSVLCNFADRKDKQQKQDKKGCDAEPGLPIDIHPSEITAEGAKAANKFLSRMRTSMKESQEREDRQPFDKETLEKVLKANQYRRASCLSLPFTLAFFILSAVSNELHEQVRLINRVEDAVDEGIAASTFDEAQSKWVKDCTGPPDIWKFLKETVVAPGVSPWFQHEDQFGNTVPLERRDRAFNTFHLVGGLLFEQVRSAIEPCGSGMPRDWDCIFPDAEALSTPFGPALQMEHNTTNRSVAYYHGEGFIPLAQEGDADFQFRGGLLDHARRLTFDEGSIENGIFGNWRRLRGGDGGGGGLDAQEGMEARKFWSPPHQRYPFFLFEQMPIKQLQERLSYLEENGWLDKQTSYLSMKGTLYNSEHRLLTRLGIIFHFASSGAVDVALKIRTLNLVAFPHPVLYCIDALWFGLLIIITFTEVQEVCTALKQGKEEIVKYSSSFWNWLDWATISMGMCIVSGFTYQSLMTEDIHERLLALPKVSESLTEDDLRKYYGVHLAVDSISHFVMYYRLLLAMYTLVLMLRFFKAFRAQPRLALVTTTMYVAGCDVAHFLFVFWTIFSTFALSSVGLFGRRLTAFSQFHLALANCFAIACGEFNWADLSAEHPLTTAVWFWSFMLIVFFVLLNMVIAIILDVYGEVRTQSEFCPPLWTQCFDMIAALRHGGWVREAKQHVIEIQMLGWLSDHKSDDVSAYDLKTVFPEVDDRHLKSIIDQVKVHEETDTSRMRISDAMRAIGVLHVNFGQGLEKFEAAKKDHDKDLGLLKGKVSAIVTKVDDGLTMELNMMKKIGRCVEASEAALKKTHDPWPKEEVKNLVNVVSKLDDRMKDQSSFSTDAIALRPNADYRASEPERIASEEPQTHLTPGVLDRESKISIEELRLEVNAMTNKMTEVLQVTKQLSSSVISLNAEASQRSYEMPKVREECNENSTDSKRLLEEMQRLSAMVAQESRERAKSEARVQQELADLRQLLASSAPSIPVTPEVYQQSSDMSKGFEPQMQIETDFEDELGSRMHFPSYNEVENARRDSKEATAEPEPEQKAFRRPVSGHWYYRIPDSFGETGGRVKKSRPARPHSCSPAHRHRPDIFPTLSAQASPVHRQQMHQRHEVQVIRNDTRNRPHPTHPGFSVGHKLIRCRDPSYHAMWSPRYYEVHPNHPQVAIRRVDSSHGPPARGEAEWMPRQPSHGYSSASTEYFLPYSVPTEDLQSREEFDTLC